MIFGKLVYQTLKPKRLVVFWPPVFNLRLKNHRLNYWVNVNKRSVQKKLCGMHINLGALVLIYDSKWQGFLKSFTIARVNRCRISDIGKGDTSCKRQYEFWPLEESSKKARYVTGHFASFFIAYSDSWQNFQLIHMLKLVF